MTPANFPIAALPSLDQADALIQQGHALEDMGHVEAALALYCQAITMAPAYPRAHLNRGNAHLALNQADAAITAYRNAIGLREDYVHAHFNLGRALLEKGAHAAAIEALQKALELQPDLSEAHVALACALEEIGLSDDAEQHYLAALAIRPTYGGARINLGILLYRKGQADQALAQFRRASTDDPDLAEAYSWLAKIYREMGHVREALTYSRKAHTLSPDDPTHHSALLFALNCAADISPDEIFSAHLEFAQRHCSFIPACPKHANSPIPERRLRIGYVSGDFIGHPVSIFLDPLLRNHDRSEVEVFGYHNNPRSDVVTARLKEKSDHWRNIANLDDESAANLVRRDQIDILIDLSGHTNLNRLLLFARKPAPIQVTWLGYLGTTGLSTMDYRICDDYTDPPGLTENQHTEQLARLPNSQWCYVPLIPLPDVSPLPMSTKGYLTLGSFNNLSKLNEAVIELWVRVLRAVPSARLLIAATPNSESRVHMAEQFQSSGIDPERLIFRGRLAPAEYFASYREVDIVLDPFPYNGGTTSFDALLMGVPVVTLAGERSISRGGVSILSNIGLSEFISATPDDYVRVVHEMAANPTRLAQLRDTLRSRMEQSPLMDAHRFARDMEQLYRQMWWQWVGAAPSPQPLPPIGPKAGLVEAECKLQTKVHDT